MIENLDSKEVILCQILGLTHCVETIFSSVALAKELKHMLQPRLKVTNLDVAVTNKASRPVPDLGINEVHFE